jgi:phage antirepressor YoqD-like protein
VAAFYELAQAAAKSPAPALLPDFSDPAAAARAWAEQFEAARQVPVLTVKLAQLEQERPGLEQRAEIAEQRAETAERRAETADRLMNAEGLHTVAQAAKILGTGEIRLFAECRKRRLFMIGNEPYQKYVERGWFVVKATYWTHPQTGVTYAHRQPLVTNSGLIALDQMLHSTTDTPQSAPASNEEVGQ